MTSVPEPGDDVIVALAAVAARALAHDGQAEVAVLDAGRVLRVEAAAVVGDGELEPLVGRGVADLDGGGAGVGVGVGERLGDDPRGERDRLRARPRRGR